MFPASDAACHIVYTSGTTGRPKGIVCEHAALANYCTAKNRYHGVDHAARVLLASANTWDPSLGDVFPTLAAGGVLCVGPRAVIIHDLATALRQSRASHIFATPALWSLLNTGPAELPDLRVVALGGEPIPEAVIAAWSPAVRLINTYGVTEATVCQLAVDAGAGVPANNVGQPMHGCLARLDCRPGDECGELLLGGVQVARGYTGPDGARLAVARFVTDADGTRWVRSGDRARRDGPNFVLIGRADNQVKLRGFRIELEEVEAVLEQSPLVAAALVTKVAAPPRLVAHITAARGVPLAAFGQGGECAVRLHCAKKLPVHEIPAQIVVLEAFPLSASGKKSRRLLPPAPALRARARAAGTAEGQNEHELRTEVERLVAWTWGAVLGIDGVGPRDNWFELGGSSVTSTQMIHSLTEQLAARDDTCHASFPVDADHMKVRVCGLQKKPRVREYAAFLEWAAQAAPNRSRRDAAAFASKLRAANTATSVGEELLARMDAEIPQEEDVAMLAVDALNAAAKYGHGTVAQALLELGTSADGRVSRTNKANSPLMIAALHDRPEVARLLLDHGASVNLTNTAMATAAHVAATSSVPVLALVLEAGGACDARDLNRWTCLHHAAWAGHTAALEVILRHDADTAAKDRWSRTAVAWAIFNNRVAAVDLLLSHGASLQARLESGRAIPQAKHQRRTDNVWSGCLHMAVQNALTCNDDCAMLRVLLRHRVPVDERDGLGGTALHQAARADGEHGGWDGGGGDDDEEHGGGDAPGRPGTPSAATLQQVAGLLLGASCDAAATDAAGRTALQVALATGPARDALAEVLSRAE